MLVKLLIGLVIVLVIVLYLVIDTLLSTYLDHKNTPKEVMFWCNKHGYFPRKYCLKLFPDFPEAQNSYVCPECYRQTVFVNPDKKLSA